MGPERPTERKAREHGATWEHARRLYLKYPLLTVADIARMLDVSRQAINEYVDDLKEEREGLRTRELSRIKQREKL
jgi:Mn-dependent DtxR family transcriptional regulator